MKNHEINENMGLKQKKQTVKQYKLTGKCSQEIFSRLQDARYSFNVMKREVEDIIKKNPTIKTAQIELLERSYNSGTGRFTRWRLFQKYEYAAR